MRTIKILCGLALSIILTTLNAQNPNRINKKLETNWTGTIVFDDGKEFTGNFTYNPIASEGLLLVKTDSVSHAFGPNVVQGFSFYDDEVGKRRYFYSLPVKNNHGVARKYFIELIHANERISILGRNTAKIQVNTYRYNGYNSTSQDKSISKNHIKYLLDHRDNHLYEFSRKEILRMTMDKGNEIRDFIREKKLKLNPLHVEDYIQVIDYYSSLKTKP